MAPEKKTVILGTPLYGGQLSRLFAMSVLKFQEACSKRSDVDFHSLLQWGDSLIPRAKQGLITQFLAAADATHLLLVDGDIGFEPQLAFKLLDLDVEVAAAAPPALGMGQAAPSKVADHPPVTHQGFLRVGFASTAFMLLKRSAIELMMGRYPGLRYVNEFAGPNTTEVLKWNYALFNSLIDDTTGIYLGGDSSFCRRWTDMGGDIWLDPKGKLERYVFLTLSNREKP